MATSVNLPLARYAERFHILAGDGHHVGSPLGAWLLLALCAPASSGSTREELTETLGADAETAFETAVALLSADHPLVRSAAAVWTRDAARTAALAGWQARLPEAVETGDLPEQDQLDEWADRNTLGLIKRFPLTVTPETILILATALATKISWETPFDIVSAQELGPDSPWTSRLTRVLRTPDADHAFGHDMYLARTDRAGDVAVHTARAADGLRVMSVIADRTIPAAEVLAVAYELAGGLATGADAARLSLFDLPLGEGPLWTLREERAATAAREGREERYCAVLPAWSASSEHKLTDTDGFPAAAAALGDLLGIGELRYEAKQAAIANYTRVGFEAAAITGLFAVESSPEYRDGVRRVAELRFSHPYAVVAVAVASDWRGSPWHGVPVFSAWVADPRDAEET